VIAAAANATVVETATANRGHEKWGSRRRSKHFGTSRRVRSSATSARRRNAAATEEETAAVGAATVAVAAADAVRDADESGAGSSR